LTVQVPKECRLDMSADDISVGKKLLEEDFIKKNPVRAKPP
jgi:hypothetical protein